MAEILLGNIKGENGATYTPALDSDGNLSWSNDKGLPNPPTVNIKGPQGPAGEVSGGGGSGDAIPKVGDRGVLAGYEEFFVSNIDTWDMSVVINPDAPDVSCSYASVTAEALDPSWFMVVAEDGSSSLRSFTKIVGVADATVTLGEGWLWQNGVVPTIGNGILIFHAPPFGIGLGETYFGFVFYVPIFE